jgi:hypothetical protein
MNLLFLLVLEDFSIFLIRPTKQAWFLISQYSEQFIFVGILVLVFQRTHLGHPDLSRSTRPRYNLQTSLSRPEYGFKDVYTYVYTHAARQEYVLYYRTILRRACVCVLYGHQKGLARPSLRPSARSSRTRHDSCRGSRTQWLAAVTRCAAGG